MPTIAPVPFDAPKVVAPQRSEQLEKLEKFVSVTDNIDSAVSGPARVVVGIMDIMHAHDKHDVSQGWNQIMIGVTSGIYGAIGTLVTLGSVATAIGLSSVGLVMASTALAVGGTTVAGFAGGAAALLKGITQIKKDDHKGIGLAKAGIGVAMLAGAACGAPVLITVGGVAYMIVSGIESRHEIAAAAHKVGSKLAQMGREVVSAVHDPHLTALALDAHGDR